MNDRNDTIAPLPMGTGNPPNVLQQPFHQGPSGMQEHGDAEPHDPALEMQCQSIAAVVSDVEQFAVSWVGRIRRLIHRSSQLIERESLLAGAIARLDQQKAEWSKRTAAKEEGLRNQSKRLTEAWLEVEAERRKAIQGARAASTAAKKSNGGPVIANPASAAAPVATVQPASAQRNLAQPATAVVPKPVAAPAQAAGRTPTYQQPTEGAPVPAALSIAAQSVAPPAVEVPTPVGVQPTVQNSPISNVVPNAPQIASVANAPISAGPPASMCQENVDAQAFEQAEAATRQKIEEFKRMQRAIRSNRNK